MQRRSLGTMFALLMITLGFYELYWLGKTRHELTARTSIPIPPVSLIFIPLLVLIATILLNLVARGNTVANVLISLLGFLALPGFYIILFWWRWRYSKAIEMLTSHHFSAPYNFWMWLITNGMWSLVLQNEFNHMNGQPVAYANSQNLSQSPIRPTIRPTITPSSTWENIRQETLAPAESAPTKPVTPPPPVPDSNQPTAPWNTPPNDQPRM